MKKPISQSKKIALFEEKEVRRTWYEDQWYFSVSDIIYILTDSNNVKQYIKKMRSRDKDLSVNWGTICTPLQVISKDGRQRQENMSQLKGIFRIIQSIPSPKAEPFKQWLAQVGQERIEEIQDPERAIVRAKKIYEQKGYSDDWIAKRMRGINIRNSLTDEWKDKGMKEGFEFAILTNEIYKGTFNMTAKGIKNYKNLRNQDNSRDHMSEIELILTMLGEASTTELSKKENPESFEENKVVARKGRNVAGKAREELELQLGSKVVTKGNFLKKEQKGLKGKKE